MSGRSHAWLEAAAQPGPPIGIDAVQSAVSLRCRPTLDPVLELLELLMPILQQARQLCISSLHPLDGLPAPECCLSSNSAASDCCVALGTFSSSAACSQLCSHSALGSQAPSAACRLTQSCTTTYRPLRCRLTLPWAGSSPGFPTVYNSWTRSVACLTCSWLHTPSCRSMWRPRS